MKYNWLSASYQNLILLFCNTLILYYIKISRDEGGVESDWLMNAWKRQQKALTLATLTQQ